MKRMLGAALTCLVSVTVWAEPVAPARHLLAVLPLDTAHAEGNLTKAAVASIEDMLRDTAANALSKNGSNEYFAEVSWSCSDEPGGITHKARFASPDCEPTATSIVGASTSGPVTGKQSFVRAIELNKLGTRFLAEHGGK